MTSWTAEATGRRLNELTQEMAEIVEALKAARLDATRKRRAASRAKSKAFLMQDGPVEFKKNKANIDPEFDAAEDAALVAEALVEALDEEKWLLKERLMNGRQLSQSIRDEARAIGLQHT